jgi:alanine-synthesizing transaminase
MTPRTRGIVVINPNNPTGAVYTKSALEDIVEVARQHDLILFADEIYDKILYDGAQHVPLAQLATDLLVVSFNGLSKAYRVAGFRTGWMIISGAKHRAHDYIEGLDILASMRLCANVPTQHAVQTALGGYQSIDDYIQPGGRLYEQRNLAHSLLTQVEGITCVKPKGALYLFPKIDIRRYNITDDERFVMDLLHQEKILVVQGTGFNLQTPDHFRIVFLPRNEDLTDAITRLSEFLGTYRQ